MAVNRWHFECSHCGAFRFADLEERDGGRLFRDVRVSKGVRAEAIATTWQAESTCTGCKRIANSRRVEGTFSVEHICDPACTSAIGPLCVCQCGGANHGISHIPFGDSAMSVLYYVVFNPSASRKKADKQVLAATPELIAERDRIRAEHESVKSAAQLKTRRDTTTKEFPEVVDWLVQNEQRQHKLDFVRDIAATFERTGRLSFGQADAIKRIMAKDAEFKARDAQRAAERAAEPTPTVNVTTGKAIKMTGTVLTVTFKRSQYGKEHDPDCTCRKPSYCDNLGDWKMLVQLNDYNKVWSSVPVGLTREVLPPIVYQGSGPGSPLVEKVRDYIFNRDDCQLFKGVRFNFVADVEANGDPHFGFCKRPRAVSGVIKPEASA